MRNNSLVGAYAYGNTTFAVHAPTTVTPSGGGAQTLAYDPNGNMTTGLDGKVMTYDLENRPLSVTVAGKKTCYVYGADGTRRKKIENFSPTQSCDAPTASQPVTLYIGQAEIRNWGKGNAEEILLYPTPSIRISLTKNAGGAVITKVSTLHRDALGSVRAVTNAAGLKAERSLFRPFGEEASTRFDLATAAETKGFIGQRLDADAGLQYLNARYYDPKLGMFIQPDWWEVTKAGVGTNRYGYSGGDPVNRSDPRGNRFNDWGMDQAAADRDNRRRADQFRALADRLRNPRTLDERISAFLGGARRAEASAREYEARIGVSRSDRIRSDMGDFLGSVIIAVAPGRVSPRAVPPPEGLAGSVRNVNPTGGTRNCVNCAIATDSTLAGRPASALPGRDTPVGVLENLFGGRFRAVSGKSAAEGVLLEAGPGARAIVFGTRPSGSGHVFNGVNQGGTVRFLDGQTGGVASFDGYSGFYILRTN